MNWLTRLAFSILVRAAYREGNRPDSGMSRFFGHTLSGNCPVDVYVVMGQHNCTTLRAQIERMCGREIM